MPKITPGTKVWLFYFDVRQMAEVIKVTPTRARVRFRNCRGQVKDAWRPLSRLSPVTETCSRCIHFSGPDSLADPYTPQCRSAEDDTRACGDYEVWP